MISAIRPTEQYFQTIERPSPPIVSLIVSIVNETFHFIQSAYFFAFGTIKLIIGLVKKETIQGKEKIKKALAWFYRKISSFRVLHGALYIGMGTCELFLGLNAFDIVSLGAAVPVIAFIRAGCFIFANIVMLTHHIKEFIEASQYSEPKNAKEKENLERIKGANILGIISTLNHIVGMAITLVGGPAAVIVLFITMAIIPGTIKTLYDFFLPQKAIVQS